MCVKHNDILTDFIDSRGLLSQDKVGHTQIIIFIFIPRSLFYNQGSDFIFILYPKINIFCDSQALATGEAASGGSTNWKMHIFVDFQDWATGEAASGGSKNLKTTRF